MPEHCFDIFFLAIKSTLIPLSSTIVSNHRQWPHITMCNQQFPTLMITMIIRACWWRLFYGPKITGPLLKQKVIEPAAGVVLSKADQKNLEEWKLKDLKAKNYLLQAIDCAILESILQKNTCKQIWAPWRKGIKGTMRGWNDSSFKLFEKSSRFFKWSKVSMWMGISRQPWLYQIR